MTANGTVPHASQCAVGASSQLWRTLGSASDEWQFQSVAVQLCLMVASTSYSLGPDLLLADCDQSQPGYGPRLKASTQWAVSGP